MATGMVVRDRLGNQVKVYLIDPKKFQQHRIAAAATTPSRLANDSSNTVVGNIAPAAALINGVPFHHERQLPGSHVRYNQRQDFRFPVSAASSSSALIEQDRLKDIDETFSSDVSTDSLISTLSKEQQTRAGRITKPRIGENFLKPLPASTGPPPIKLKRRDPPEFFRCQTCKKFYLGNTKLKGHLKKFPTHQASADFQRTMAPPKRRLSCSSVAVQCEVGEVELATSRSLSLELDSSPMLNGTMPSPSPGNVTSIASSGDELSRESSASEISISPSPPPPPLLRSLTSTAIPSFNEVVSGGSLQHSATPPIPPQQSLPPWNVFKTFRNIDIRRNLVSPPNASPPSLVMESPTSCSRRDDDITGSESSTSSDQPSPGGLTVWDLVERKLLQNGINQMLVELSDVAEKLGKLARDKIIPIGEDEEERLPTSIPVVRVENPFMSHLLDLPFGTYVFREDAGIRRPPLPPPISDLSLTAGEVDIDKFLSSDIEMDHSLPHLTNLDIAAICNN